MWVYEYVHFIYKTYAFLLQFLDLYRRTLACQNQIKAQPVAACYMTSELRSEVGVSWVKDIRDIWHKETDRWDM